METQMDAHSVAVISRDGWGRQRCGSVPASSTTRREKQNRTKFGNVRKRGQEMIQRHREKTARHESWGWERWETHRAKTVMTRAQRRKMRRGRDDRWVTMHPEGRTAGTSRHEWHKSKMSLRPPPQAHLHLPPPHQTQHRLTELSTGPEAMQWLCQTPLWAKLSDFRHVLKIHLESPHSLFLVTVLGRDDSFSMSASGRLGRSQTSSSSWRL